MNMEWLLEKLGALFDRIVGDRTTFEHLGPAAHRQVTLRPSFAGADVQIGVRITQTIYTTRYKRWWIPSTVHPVYHVLAFAPDEVREKLDQRLFEPMVYPLLCNQLLMHTRYPHLYALHAFLERMSPFYQTIKCEL